MPNPDQIPSSADDETMPESAMPSPANEILTSEEPALVANDSSLKSLSPIHIFKNTQSEDVRLWLHALALGKNPVFRTTMQSILNDHTSSEDSLETLREKLCTQLDSERLGKTDGTMPLDLLLISSMASTLAEFFFEYPSQTPKTEKPSPAATYKIESPTIRSIDKALEAMHDEALSSLTAFFSIPHSFDIKIANLLIQFRAGSEMPDSFDVTKDAGLIELPFLKVIEANPTPPYLTLSNWLSYLDYYEPKSHPVDFNNRIEQVILLLLTARGEDYFATVDNETLLAFYNYICRFQSVAIDGAAPLPPREQSIVNLIAKLQASITVSHAASPDTSESSGPSLPDAFEQYLIEGQVKTPRPIAAAHSIRPPEEGTTDSASKRHRGDASETENPASSPQPDRTQRKTNLTKNAGCKGKKGKAAQTGPATTPRHKVKTETQPTSQAATHFFNTAKKPSSSDFNNRRETRATYHAYQQQQSPNTARRSSR